MKQIHDIRILSKEVSEKIAAGEVVDRPQSIVKELVENSLDAGSDNIVIEIKQGGKTYIRVTDNGCGIPEKDVEIAFMRHATSKIRSDRDLEAIDTLGFRGEALASIAAVSKVEIITKAKEEKMGTRILIEGGNLIEKSHAGCPNGTTIIISDIFYNTPARLKFMKSEGAEAALIIDFISKMALAYPFVSFRMINNGMVLFATRGEGDIYKSILNIYGKEAGERLIAIDERSGEYYLEAYISPPDVNRATKKSQVYFVNGRVIKDKIIDSAVSKAYNELIKEGRSPLIYLFLRVPNNTVDVNIHPNKKEVRFENNGIVSDFITSAMKKALLSQNGLSQITIKNDIFVLTEENTNLMIDQYKGREQVDIKTLLVTEKEKTSEYEADLSVIVHNKENKSLPFYNLQILGSVFATYILATDEDNLYLIDQHAAHERVLYEKLLSEFHKEEKDTQLLLSAFLIEISPAAVSNIEFWMGQLIKMGFEIEAFGHRSVLLKGIPSFMDLEGAKRFIGDFTLEAEGLASISDPIKIEKIITKSCKSAVKANKLLKTEEIDQLIKDLSMANNPLSCPHGRPTLLKLSQRDIERLFKR